MKKGSFFLVLSLSLIATFSSIHTYSQDTVEYSETSDTVAETMVVDDLATETEQSDEYEEYSDDAVYEDTENSQENEACVDDEGEEAPCD